MGTKSSKGYTDTKGTKESNNACDRIPLKRLTGRKGDKKDTVDKKKKRQESYMTEKDLSLWDSTS